MGGADFCVDTQQGILGATNITFGGPSNTAFQTLQYAVECTDPRTPDQVSQSVWESKGMYQFVGEYYFESRSAVHAIRRAVSAARSSSLVVTNLNEIVEGTAQIEAASSHVACAANCVRLQPGFVSPVQSGFCDKTLEEGMAFIWVVQTLMCVVAVFSLLFAVPFCHTIRHPGGSRARRALHELAATTGPYTAVSPASTNRGLELA